MFLTNLSVAVALSPGCVYDLSIPHTVDNDYGFTPRAGASTIEGISGVFQNGFIVENEEVGVIHHVYEDQVKVAYHHKLAMNNTVWFVSFIGHKVAFSIAAVTPHDHATVSTGGPAYGTYFTAI